ncbi:MAG: hypothetical protein AAFX55_00330 [Bacteroidota bacterium]
MRRVSYLFGLTNALIKWVAPESGDTTIKVPKTFSTVYPPIFSSAFFRVIAFLLSRTLFTLIHDYFFDIFSIAIGQLYPIDTGHQTCSAYRIAVTL